MAKCRLLSISPPCGYVAPKVMSLRVMDSEDFGGFEFQGDARPEVALVTKIYGEPVIATLPKGRSTNYTLSKQGNVYTHTVETFAPSLSAEIMSALDLASKRQYIVLFAAGGKEFTFGMEAGASLTFRGQTADGLGCAITLAAKSKYPLFEVQAGAEIGAAHIDFNIDFALGAYCAF